MSKARLLPGSVYPAELGLTGVTVVVPPGGLTLGNVRLMVANPTVPTGVVTFEPAGVDVFDPGAKASHSGPRLPMPIGPKWFGGELPSSKVETLKPGAVNSNMSPGPEAPVSATNRLPAL